MHGKFERIPRSSLNYVIELNPDITILKEVSVDGGPFVDANMEPPDFPTGVPGSTAQFRLTVTNTGDEPLVDVILNDAILGLVNVPLPGSCLVGGAFQPGDNCVITSATANYEPLFLNPVCDMSGDDHFNIADVAASGQTSGTPVGDEDPANVECLVPDILVTKNGPPLAKAGDDVIYEICAQNTGETELENCTASDTKLGSLGGFPTPPFQGAAVCQNYPHMIPANTVEDPYENTATVTCDVVGSASSVNDSNDHSTNLFQPSIDVTKTGPDTTKVGDEVCYDISFDNTSSGDTPPLINCTGNDPLFGGALPGTFVDGVAREFCYTTQPGDVGSLVNTGNHYLPGRRL